MARCLVTGHKGYIGSSVFNALKRAGNEVMGIDLQDGDDILNKLSPGAPIEISSRWVDFAPEYIFHLAAIPRVGYSVENPVHVIENNVLSSLYVLELARAVGAKRVIYSSSSSVVGNGDGPENPYGASKLMPESMCEVWSRLYDVDTVCLRYFNVYSPDQKADGPYATAVANWMQFIRDEKRPFITGDGEQRRDMAHKMDIVSANIFCMEHSENFVGKWFDVGTGENVSLNEMKVLVHRYFPNVVFNYAPAREGDVDCTKADITPLTKMGWAPTHGIDDGVSECFSLLKEELS